MEADESAISARMEEREKKKWAIQHTQALAEEDVANAKIMAAQMTEQLQKGVEEAENLKK